MLREIGKRVLEKVDSKLGTAIGKAVGSAVAAVSVARGQEPHDLADFTIESFSHDGVTRPVYRRGSGPGVVLMHELPGITPQAAGLARTIARAGYTVLMPSLFGTPGKEFTAGYTMFEASRACVAGEFAVFATNQSSPIVDWLRALCRAAHAELGGPGVGVIGMCFTGNFAISLMAEPAVMAPIASQPSLPFGSVGERAGSLHVSDDDLVKIRKRARAGVPLLGLRFTGDVLCPAARFERLRAELGDRFEAVEVDSSPGNAHGIRRVAHSVLTLDFVDTNGHPTRAALDRVLGFLRDQLQKPAAVAQRGPL
jgi:dienelactone hydrolase